MYANTPQLCVKKIRAALEKDARINLHQSNINIDFKDDTLYLMGQVTDITVKRLANTIARQVVKGDFVVEDCLRVEGDTMGDKEIKNRVIQILGQEPIFASHTILIKTGDDLEIIHDFKANANRILASIKNGIITLSGDVNSINHKRLAEVLMWWIPGCQQVVNFLEINPHQLDNDSTLSDAIRMVLEKDPLVHTSQLHIGTTAGVVKLNGYLPSEQEHIFAVRDTWTVPGVQDVLDNIQVGGSLL